MSEIAAELGYYRNQPVICLKPRVERSSNKNKRYLVGMQQLHYWSEEHNESFEAQLFNVGHQIYELFDLGTPNSRQLADVATAIQSRIDDLIKMPPDRPRRVTVGEATIKADGEEMTAEIRDKVNGRYKQYRDG